MRYSSQIKRHCFLYEKTLIALLNNFMKTFFSILLHDDSKEMPGANCSMYGCGTSRKHKDIGIFKLPLPKDEFHRKWRKDLIDIILRYRVLDKNLERQIQEDRIHICQRHFQEDQFYIYPSRKLLKEGALPTLNLVPSNINKMVTSGRRKLSASPNTFSSHIPSTSRLSAGYTLSNELSETPSSNDTFPSSNLWTRRSSIESKKMRTGSSPLQLAQNIRDPITKPPPLEKIQNNKPYPGNETRPNVSEVFSYRHQSEDESHPDSYSKSLLEGETRVAVPPPLIQDVITSLRDETKGFEPHITTTTTSTRTNAIATFDYAPYPSFSGSSRGRDTSAQHRSRHYHFYNRRTKQSNSLDHPARHQHNHDHIEIHQPTSGLHTKRPFLHKHKYDNKSSSTFKRSLSFNNHHRSSSPDLGWGATNTYISSDEIEPKRHMKEDDDGTPFSANPSPKETHQQHHEYVDAISLEENNKRKNQHKECDYHSMSPVYNYPFQS